MASSTRPVHAHDLRQPYRLDSLAVTQMNTDSSRSHTIVQFTISSTRVTSSATACDMASPHLPSGGNRVGIASDEFPTINNDPNDDGTTNAHHDGTRGCSDGTTTVQASCEGGRNIAVITTRAKLSLVDLAGSERGGAGGEQERNNRGSSSSQGDSLPQGEDDRAVQEKERVKINSSLHALSNCISCLGEARRMHVPFRDSPLTR